MNPFKHTPSATSYNGVKHNISTLSTIPEYPLSNLSANRASFRTEILGIDSASGLAWGPLPCTRPSACRLLDGQQPFHYFFSGGVGESRSPIQTIRHGRGVCKLRTPSFDLGAVRDRPHCLSTISRESGNAGERPGGPGCGACVAGRGQVRTPSLAPAVYQALTLSTGTRMVAGPRRAWRIENASGEV